MIYYANVADGLFEAPDGLDASILRSIFFGYPEGVDPPPNLAGAPPATAHTFSREYGALGWNRRAILSGRLAFPDPTRPGELAEVLESRVAEHRGALPFEQVPVFHRTIFSDGTEAWICCYSATGRVTQVLIPSRKWCAHYGGQSTAEAVIDSLGAVRTATNKERSERTVFVGELLNNFGHQALNVLSGLERVVDRLPPSADIVLIGRPDFLDIFSLFPGLQSRSTRLVNRWDLSGYLRPGDTVVRIEDVQPSERALDAVENLAARKAPAKPVSRPILAVTVREVSRRCLNLPEVVGKIVEQLRLTYPDLGVVVDGWVLPEADGLDDLSRVSTTVDLRAVEDVRARLPGSTFAGTVVGTRFLDSVSNLSGAHAAFVHVGTLQHKYGLFTRAQTVVHGPASQLAYQEPAAFAGTGRPLPHFLSPHQVRDVRESEQDRRSDYEIVDIDGVVAQLRLALETGRTAAANGASVPASR